MAMTGNADAAGHGGTDSTYAWLRLAAAVLLSTLGGVGMWSVVVTLPAAQVQFAVDRGAASLPFTLTMFGFAAGGVMMGRFADKFGVVAPVVFGSVMLGIGYVAVGYAATLWQYALAQGVLIALSPRDVAVGPDRLSGEFEPSCAASDPEANLASCEITAARKRAVADVLATLTARDRHVVEARAMAEDARTLDDLAGELRLSRERVRQLEARALRRIGETFVERGLAA